jgi:hypothetical protein
MKKNFILLLAVCFLCTRSNAQNAEAVNSTPCGVIVNYILVNTSTCAIVATAVPAFTVPAGTTPPGIFTSMAWTPAPPPGLYDVGAEVSYVGCTAPPVRVGGGSCFPHTQLLPTVCRCGSNLVDFSLPNPMTIPVPPPIPTFPLNVHP